MHRVAGGIKNLTIGGALTLAGYVALFLLLQSRAVWESPTLVPDRWPWIFYPIKQLFPQDWVLAERTSGLGLLDIGLYLLLIICLFAIYVWVVHRAFSQGAFRASHGRRAIRLIFFFTAVALAILLVVPGMFSSDLFSYVSYGRIFAIYGDNPFTSYPAQYAWYDTDMWVQWVRWDTTPSVYGPLWLWLAGGIALIADRIDGDIVTHLLGHKVLASSAHLLNVWLVWKVAGAVIARYWREPRLAAGVSRGDWLTGTRIAVCLAYAWNPLLMIEFGASAHNDVLLVTGLLTAIWLHLKGRWRLAALALAGACLVKYGALIFVPGYLWLLAWEAPPGGAKDGLPARLGRVAQAVGIMSLAFVAAYWPFAGNTPLNALLSGGPPSHFFINSLGAIIRYKLADGVGLIAWALEWTPAHFWLPVEIGWRLDWPARWGLMAITVALAVYHTWRARTFPGMVTAWGWVIFIYLTVGAVWFWPWYVAWLIVPVVLVGPGRLWTATQILCASSMTLYAVFPRIAPPLDDLADWSGSFIMGPPLIYLLASYALDRMRGRATRRAPHAPQGEKAVDGPMTAQGPSAA